MQGQLKRKSERISFPIKFKAEGDAGMVTGYASIFGNVDSYGDVVEPGAFKKTVQERVPKGLVKFLADHNWSSGSVLGTVIEASEDARGLLFKAQLSQAPSVQDVRTKMLEGHLNRCSFGFRTIREEYRSEGEAGRGDKIRHLLELSLYDISVVPFAANEEAVITGVKGEELSELLLAIKQGELSETEIKAVLVTALGAAGDNREKILREITAGPGTPPTEAKRSEGSALSLVNYQLLRQKTQLLLDGVIQ